MHANDKTYSRRGFSKLASAAVLAGVALPKVFHEVVAAQPTSFSEAPTLAEQVEAGTLPPVEERLPPEPLVVEPTTAIGSYGGTIYSATLAPEAISDIQFGMVTGLFQFSSDLSVITPEVATGYEFNDDSTACTITLREGIKWSDGEPFTTDDMVFYFDDWQFNTDLNPTTPGQWVVGGERIGFSKVDDYTMEFTFARPNPAFNLIHYSGAPVEPWRARHYLEQFHIDYNPNADAAAQEAGYDNWMLHFQAMSAATTYNYGAQNPELPVLGPWRPVSNDTQRQQYERNPYYFKVDPEGNQLPYVDYVTVDYVGDLQVMNLRAISGELSLAGKDLELVNYPLILQGEEEGDYTSHLVQNERGADVALAFNLIHPDPVLNELFNDVRFRQAMSLGINRDEINEIVFLGQGTPRQATINESARFFKQEWADHYAIFDPPQANAMLDELGLDQRNDAGIRLRSDGEPLEFQLEYLPQEGPKQQVSELVVRQWADLGVSATSAARQRNYLIQRVDNGEHDVTGWHIDRTLERSSWAYRASSKLSPGGDSAIRYAQGWREWFASGGESGVQPPEEALELAAAFDEWQTAEFGSPEYFEVGTRVFDLVAERLYVLGTVGQAPQPLVVKNNLANVMPDTDDPIWWGPANWMWKVFHVEQWYFTTS